MASVAGIEAIVYVDRPSPRAPQIGNQKMSPAQSRAARALLGWTQPQLADAAGLGISSIADFERERHMATERTTSKIRAALEGAGVVFLDIGEISNGGPGVRLREPVEAAKMIDKDLVADSAG